MFPDSSVAQSVVGYWFYFKYDFRACDVSRIRSSPSSGEQCSRGSRFCLQKSLVTLTGGDSGSWRERKGSLLWLCRISSPGRCLESGTQTSRWLAYVVSPRATTLRKPPSSGTPNTCFGWGLSQATSILSWSWLTSGSFLYLGFAKERAHPLARTAEDAAVMGECRAGAASDHTSRHHGRPPCSGRRVITRPCWRCVPRTLMLTSDTRGTQYSICMLIISSDPS